MTPIILSINAGSSSVKISVYQSQGKDQDPKQLAETQVSGLTAPPAKYSYARGSIKKKSEQVDRSIGSQDDAFTFLLDQLVTDEGLTEISCREDINVTCHRIVQGGNYQDARLINSDTMQHLEELTDLAPLYVVPATPSTI